jgi:Flp pilus assembly protein TadG
MNGTKKTLTRSSGQASVEFILTVALLTIFIFGLVEVLMFAYTVSVLGDAAKEGVRVAIVHGADYSPSSGQDGPTSGAGAACPNATSTTAPDVYTAVQNTAKVSFHDVSGMTINICYPDKSNAVPNRVQVQVSYPFKPLLGVLPWSGSWGTVTLSTAAEGRIAY